MKTKSIRPIRFPTHLIGICRNLSYKITKRNRHKFTLLKSGTVDYGDVVVFSVRSEWAWGFVGRDVNNKSCGIDKVYRLKNKYRPKGLQNGK